MCAATFVMAVLLLVLDRLLHGWSPIPAIAALVVAGAASYVLAVQFAGGTDLRELKSMLARRRGS